MNSEVVVPQENKRAVSRVPAYRRVEEDIRSRVRDGSLPAGTMLASRHNLAREYGVALSTAQQAIANLIADGVLETYDRRGTFVTQPSALRHGGRSRSVEGVRPVASRELRTEQSSEASSDAPVGLRLEQTSATLGIVATARIAMTEAPDIGSLWAHLAIRSLEHVFSAAGGTTRFFDRYPKDRRATPASG